MAQQLPGRLCCTGQSTSTCAPALHAARTASTVQGSGAAAAARAGAAAASLNRGSSRRGLDAKLLVPKRHRCLRWREHAFRQVGTDTWTASGRCTTAYMTSLQLQTSQQDRTWLARHGRYARSCADLNSTCVALYNAYELMHGHMHDRCAELQKVSASMHLCSGVHTTVAQLDQCCTMLLPAAGWGLLAYIMRNKMCLDAAETQLPEGRFDCCCGQPI